MKANLCIYIFPKLVQPKMSFLQKWYFSKAVFRSENIFDITTGCMFTPFWIHDWDTLVNGPFDTCHHSPTSLVNLSTLFRITFVVIVIIIRDVRRFLATGLNNFWVGNIFYEAHFVPNGVELTAKNFNDDSQNALE